MPPLTILAESKPNPPAAMPDDTISIPLTYPIQAHGEPVSVLVLRRPKLKDLRAMDQAEGQVGKMAALVAQLGGLPPSSVDQIDAADWMQVAGVVGDFLGLSPGTGAT